MRRMKQTDPQFKLRLPQDLKDRLESVAASSRRSLTAEIIARLEISLLSESGEDKIIPASKARELAEVARREIPAVVRERVLQAIRRAVAMGHGSATVHFDDLGLEALPESYLEQLIDGIDGDLKAAGYQTEWDGGLGVWINF